MKKIVIFAGTSEGRRLIESISGEKSAACDHIRIIVFVATEYGKEVFHNKADFVEINSGRLDAEAMTEVISDPEVEVVFDTTHPFAKDVTKNIKNATKSAGKKYIRLLREDFKQIIEKKEEEGLLVSFANMDEAADYLCRTEGRVLMTIGSKELHRFIKVPDYKERLFARVLPMESVVKECLELGFAGRQLICMQGPFSMDMNIAMIDQYKADMVLTKDSGDVGGLVEKIQAAQRTDTKLLVVRRPVEEEGLSLMEIKEYLTDNFGLIFNEAAYDKFNTEETTLPDREEIKKDYFPMFKNIGGKKVLIIGAGHIATRRIKSLLSFNVKIRVISENYIRDFSDLSNERNIEFVKKPFILDEVGKSEIKTADIVITATDSEELNHEIVAYCKGKNIEVNSVSDKKDCTFFFPGIVHSGDITIGITAQGKDHHKAAQVTKYIREFARSINWKNEK